MESIINIEEVQKDDIIIFHVKGKLDSIISPSLEKKAIEHINNGQSKLVLDLSEVHYVNSAGLRMLLAIKKQAKASAGKFIVCCINPEVMEIMKICGFDHVLDISKSEEEAFHKF